MRKFYNSKISSSLFIVTLIFSLLTPAFAAAEKSVTVEQKEKLDERLELVNEIIGEQEDLLKKEPTIHPDLLRDIQGDSALKSSGGKVDVIVQFSEAPVALAKGKKMVKQQTFSAADETSVKSNIQKQHEAFDTFVKKNNISVTKGPSYDTVLNGMALTMKASDVEALLEVPGIVSIEKNHEVHALETPDSEEEKVTPHMDQTVPHLDIPELWDRGITGEGVKVAVLDTGIDYDHPDLKDVYKGGENFVEHDGTYTTVREDDDPYETYPSERAEGVPEFNDDGSSFYTSHGTHVAGTIAAQGNNEYGIKGIAPDIELYAYRVLGAYGSGTMAGIIEAIEASVDNNMDIINLSLGGGSADENSADTMAINNAALEGVTSVIATGNAGPGRGTIGNPSTARLGIAVGNSTPPEELKSSSVQVEAGDYSNEVDMELMAWTYGSDPAEDLAGEFEIVAVPGYGTPEDFADLDVEGKVALISRGDIAFVDKIYAARDAGAVGTLIHNNEGSGPADVFLSTAFNFIPSYDMATEDGEALRDALKDNDGTVSFGDFNTEELEGEDISDTSSQGPTTPNFDIKPDVLAPGTNIMSSVPAYLKDFPDASFDQAFDRASGTSMATPHVAAVAALLKSENPDWDPFDIKVALSNTAKQLDTERYDVFAQGAGLVQPVAAMDAEAYAYALDTANVDGTEVDNIKGTVTFGNIEPTDEEQTITKEIDVRNVTGDASDYEISIDVTKSATGDMEGASISVDKDSVSVSESETLTVTLTVPAGEASFGDELLGYINMSNGNTDLSLPFAAAFAGEDGGSGESDIANVYLDDYAIAIGSDGEPSETEFNFDLLDIQMVTFAELWDASDPTGGVDGDGAIGQLGGGQLLTPGSYYMEIDGTYIDYADEEEKLAADGVYTIDLLSQNIFGDISGEWDGPFYIKSTNPVIEFDEIDTADESSTEAVTGMIDDQFVGFKEDVEENIGLPYDVNEHLTATYAIDGVDLEDDSIIIGDDGDFAISTTDLDEGDYTLTLSVVDRLGHTAEDEIDFSVAEKPETIEVSLTPSTTDPTEDPITIDVETDSETDLTDIKWLAGDKEIDDFAEAGENIDLEASAFEVDENGLYTVYVKNENDTEAVGTIDITNIGAEEDSFTIDLTPSPTEDTEDEVTIAIETDSSSDLTNVKWLEGTHDADAFADAGEEVSLEEMSFVVDENATYTVFVENSNGTQEVQSIAITNIINPDASAFDLTFDASPEEETEGPVTITVDSDSESDLTSLQWLPGVVHSPEAFEEDGNEIDLETSAFDVEENGVYTVLAVNEEDAVAIGYVTVDNIAAEEPVSFAVDLTPSTTEDTEGPVTIDVATDSEATITAAKWLAGEKDAADFADDGNTIDLDKMAFDVTENDTYSVFVQNEDGVEVVQTITVSNIVAGEPDPDPEDPEEKPEPIRDITFELSKEERTNDPITVKVNVDTKADVTDMKWHEGRVGLEEARNNGNSIGLDDRSFVITENGTYSVYVKNSDGVEALTTITITNIIPEQPEEPEKPGTPGDPSDPQPCIPCDDNDGGDGDNGDDGTNGNNNGNNGGSGDGTNDNGGSNGEKLPATATNTFNFIAIGLLLTIAGGLAAFVVYRRKKKEAVEIE